MEDKVFFTATVKVGDETLVATVYEGEACAVFTLFGKRGGSRGRVVVPASVLADCVYAINDESNDYGVILTKRAVDEWRA